MNQAQKINFLLVLGCATLIVAAWVAWQFDQFKDLQAQRWQAVIDNSK